jgi:S-adenosylmethionine/arginine decarboxylase-like enzyme
LMHKDDLLHLVIIIISFCCHSSVLTPIGPLVMIGLVDMHSHVGLHSWPENNALNDVNEETSPIFPAV